MLGDRPMLDACWDNDHFARPQLDVAITELDGQLSVEHHKQLVGIGMRVPHELAEKLDDLDLVVV